MTKPKAAKQDFGEYPDTVVGHLLERLDCAVEAGDKRVFVQTKQELWHRITDGCNSDDIVSLIALSEIDWHNSSLEYFADWQRLSVGYIPDKYCSPFVVK